MAILLMFFFNDTATTEIYTLSLHDALPISFVGAGGTVDIVIDETLERRWGRKITKRGHWRDSVQSSKQRNVTTSGLRRSEEHTSELQSRQYLVCRLLLEKKKKLNIRAILQK